MAAQAFSPPASAARIRLVQRLCAPAEAAAWEVARLGDNLMDRYNVVFEALSVVLLLAIIGAIVIARRPSTASQTVDEGGEA